jgi:hypothetical protein
MIFIPSKLRLYAVYQEKSIYNLKVQHKIANKQIITWILSNFFHKYLRFQAIVYTCTCKYNIAMKNGVAHLKTCNDILKSDQRIMLMPQQESNQSRWILIHTHTQYSKT